MTSAQYRELKHEILTLRRMITTISGGGGGGSNAFGTIAVSGQSNVVADASSDTLTLAAGSNVTLTTNAGTDTVTIAASGSGAGDLLDFVYVRKASDESVTSNTTLQADDELLFAIGANETWDFEIILNHLGNETNDIKIAVSGPTGCAGEWSVMGNHDGSAVGARYFNGQSVTTFDNSTTLAMGNVSTARTATIIKGLARNGANAGSITLYWAQNTSNGTATTVKADSHLTARRFA